MQHSQLSNAPSAAPPQSGKVPYRKRNEAQRLTTPSLAVGAAVVAGKVEAGQVQAGGLAELDSGDGRGGGSDGSSRLARAGRGRSGACVLLVSCLFLSC